VPIVRACTGLMHDYEQWSSRRAVGGDQLRTSDIQYARARECQANVYLVADIDRGGAFAICWAPGIVRSRGASPRQSFILNKFAVIERYWGTPWMLYERTGIPRWPPPHGAPCLA